MLFQLDHKCYCVSDILDLLLFGWQITEAQLLEKP